MDVDHGVLEMKSMKEMEEYMDNLGLKFEYSCVREHNPVSCHSFAQWCEAYKRQYDKAAAVLNENCYKRKFSQSCLKYAHYMLVGKPGVPRNPQEAFRSVDYGCMFGNDPTCCFGAGKLIADGIASHAPSLKHAIPFFQRGCDLGHSASCFHLGGAHMTEASKDTNSTSKADSLKQALASWTRACNLGHKFSCINVARMYRNGDGVEMNEQTARSFEEKAKEATQENGSLVQNKVTIPDT